MSFSSLWQLVKDSMKPEMKRGTRRSKRPRPRLELLEDRCLLSVYTVNSALDNNVRDDVLTLREALSVPYAAMTGAEQAQVDTAPTPGQPDQVHFNIPGEGPHTIQLLSRLDINADVVIDGYTQPGAHPNTLAVGDDAVLQIELDGSLNQDAEGLHVASQNFTLRGFAVNRFGSNISPNIAIAIDGSPQQNITIQGNFIGTDITGSFGLGNGHGVWFFSGQSILLGGTTPAARNIISGNGSGAVVYSQGTLVQGNYIGTDHSGTKAIANIGYGLSATSGLVGGTTPEERNIISGNTVGVRGTAKVSGNWIGLGVDGLPLGNDYGVNPFGDGGIIGGTLPGEGNVISGNLVNGIYLGAIHCLIQGNFIGLDPTGTEARGNGVVGSYLSGGIVVLTNDNVIGGTVPGARNVVSGNYGVGINTVNGPTTLVQGNYIGTDYTGTKAVGNATGVISGGLVGGTTPAERNIITGNYLIGVSAAIVSGNWIGLGADGLPLKTSWAGVAGVEGGLIGGTAPGAGNVISGNPTRGVWLRGSGSVVQGNFIGTDPTGTYTFADYPGESLADIWVQGAGNVIGGSAPAARNIISGGSWGIFFGGSSAHDNVVHGNYVGTDVTGTQALGNAKGIEFLDGPSNNLIGGTQPGDGNLIAFNYYFGVGVDSGTGNAIRGNSIHDNFFLGIDLGGGGVTPNHVGAATGPNNFQNYPVLTGALGGGTTTQVSGTLNSLANTTYSLDFYANPSADPSGHGEGQYYLGSAQVTTDATGNVSFTVSVGATSVLGEAISATATDANGNTSEFAADITLKGALTVTVNNSLMLAGNNPQPLTASVNGTPFTSPFNYHTPFGDTITVTLSTTATAASPVGQYTITAGLSGANSGNYIIDPATSHLGTMYVVSVGADPSSTTGAQAVAFWDNKGNKALITDADLASLGALNLVNQGGADFDPHAVAQLQAWLSVSPNAKTSYLLAVQLAVLDLNVLAGYVHSTDLVYAGSLLSYQATYGIAGLTSGGFISVQNLMNAANSALALDPKAQTSAAYETALTAVIQAVNSNSDFVVQEVNWNLIGQYLAGAF